MSKILNCDICGIRMGVQLDRLSVSIGFDNPHYTDFMPVAKEFHDICNNCDHKLRHAVMKTIDKLKVDAPQESAE